VTVQANAMPDEAHMTEADRRQIQSALLRLGYYDKTVDGVFGADTRAAIRRFQHEIGADMTGFITPAESSRLLGSGK
jgi:peptidoglycan hydrolase-like protein with peptidoglycan-binding domain